MFLDRLKKRSVRAAVAAAALAVALTGCTGSGPDTQKADGNGKGSVPVLTYSFIGPPLFGMNPAKTGGGTSAIFNQLPYSTILHEQPDGTFVGDLATKWGYVGKGNLAFEFTLRHDAVFTDGSPVNAAAVVKSLKYERDGKFFKSRLMAHFQTIEATGKYSVKITFSEPVPNVEAILSPSTGNNFIINPKALKDPKSLDNATEGSGPYIYDPATSVANVSYVFTRNPHYYNPDAVKADKVVVKVLSDPNAVLNAVRTGQVDVAVGNATVAKAAKEAGVKVVTAPVSPQGLFLLDRQGTIVKALADVRVRKAINFALGRKQITSAVAPGGLGTPTDQLIAKGDLGYEDKLADTYTQDLGKAKQLLAEAGYKNGFSFDVVCSTVLPNCTFASAIKSDLAKVGITMQIKSMGGTVGQYDNTLASGKVPASIAGLPPSIFDFGPFITPGQNGSSNPFNSTDPKVTKLFDALNSEGDAGKRTELARDLNTYLTEQAWFAPVYVSSTVFFMNPKVKNFKISGANGNWQVVNPKPELTITK